MERMQGVFFMYKDEQLEQAEHYERKLQLVQAVRAENQANTQRIQHRNSIFYSVNGEAFPKESYDKSIYGVQNKEPYKSSSLLGLRICISVLLVFAYMGLKTGKIPTVSGINAKEIKADVAQDFSKVVVDYMKNILKDDKSFYFIVGLALIIPIIIGLTYVFATVYIGQ